SLSLSCEVLPQIREFYRMSTTVINAYIAPVMANYLSRLGNRLKEIGVTTPKLYIMQSNGGVSTFDGSTKKPVATVLSGPAGGVIASNGTCGRVGIKNITITDANVVTGVLDPNQFLGGKMKLDKTKAERTLEEKIARPLSLSLLEAADGILKIINVKMEEAIKAVSSQRGYDIRDFTLVAFGGGGPMHAGRMALDLGIPAVLVPLTPGVHSALGLLMSDVKHDYVRSKLVGLDELDLNEINNLFAQLTERAKADLNAEGFQDKEIKIEPFLDLRYAGQGY